MQQNSTVTPGYGIVMKSTLTLELAREGAGRLVWGMDT